MVKSVWFGAPVRRKSGFGFDAGTLDVPPSVAAFSAIAALASLALSRSIRLSDRCVAVDICAKSIASRFDVFALYSCCSLLFSDSGYPVSEVSSVPKNNHIM
jgi:hypothetical protein